VVLLEDALGLAAAQERHPALLGLGAALTTSAGLLARQTMALAVATTTAFTDPDDPESARITREIVSAYLKHMHGTEEPRP
jgi:hypothetical protein